MDRNDSNHIIKSGVRHAVQVAQGSPVRVFVPLGGPVECALLARLLEPVAV